MVVRSLLVATLLAAAMAALALVFGQAASLISIAAGAIMAMASFVVLVVVVVRSFAIECGPAAVRRQPLALLAIVGCTKLMFLGAALWWLINRQLVSPLPFLAGFTSMVAALLLEGLRSGRAQARGR